ncbi:TetR family transcriptional regulator [Saccharothrix violaceirubra]
MLDAAAGLIAAHGARGLRMADVATKAGVSRQTVYNEFRNKGRLVQAVALHKTAEFVDGLRERMAGCADPVDGLRAGFGFAFDLAASDPLARSVLGGAHAEDMLPMLTTRGRPVLDLATAAVAAHVREHWPLLTPERTALVADTAVRIAISHLLTPATCGVESVVEVTVSLIG